MADVYFDSSSLTNGTGALGDPRNTYAGYTFTANNRYFFRRESIFAGIIRPQSQVSAATTPLTFKAYWSNANGLDDTTRRMPIIDHQGGSNGTGAIFIDTCTNVVVDSLFAINSTSAGGAGVRIRRSIGVEVARCDCRYNLAGIHILQDQAEATSITTDIYIHDNNVQENRAGMLYEYANVATAYIKRLRIINNRVVNNGKLYSVGRPGGISHWSNRASGAGAADSGDATYACYDVTIQGNLVEDNDNYSIAAYNLRNEFSRSSVVDNIVRYNNRSGAVDSHNIWMGACHYNLVARNHIHDNTGFVGGGNGTCVGVFLDFNSHVGSLRGGTGNVVCANDIHDQWTGPTAAGGLNAGAGVFNLANDFSWIFANKIQRCRSGISQSAGGASSYSNNNKIFNNVIVDCLGGLIPGNTGATQVSGIGIGVDAGNNVEIFNNIISGADYGRYLNNTLTGSVELNNLIYNIRKQVALTGSSYLALTPGSPHASTLLVDPKLTSELELADESPCIGAGVFRGYYRDFNGNTMYNLPDLGAIAWERARTARV